RDPAPGHHEGPRRVVERHGEDVDPPDPHGRAHGYVRRFAHRPDYRNANDGYGHADTDTDEGGGARPPLRLSPLHAARPASVLGRPGHRLGPEVDAHRQ